MLNINKILNILLIILSLEVYTSLLANDDCHLSYTQTSLLKRNVSSQVSPEKYDRPHIRSRSDYSIFLGRDFKKYIHSLNEGNVFIDSGAGFGLLGLQMASKKIKSYSINTQDFWSYFVNHKEPRQLLSYIKPLIQTFNIPIDDLEIPIKVFEEFSVHLYRKMSDENFIKLHQRVIDQISPYRQHYLIGFSEQVLPQIKEKANLITDLYGAFFYSSLKTELIETYYNHLSDNGRAYIRLATNGKKSVLSGTTFPSGSKIKVKTNQGDIDFYKYLETKYPTIFSITEKFDDYPQVLEIKKDMGIDKLDLQLETSPDNEYVDIGGMHIPEVIIYYEK